MNQSQKNGKEEPKESSNGYWIGWSRELVWWLTRGRVLLHGRMSFGSLCWYMNCVFWQFMLVYVYSLCVCVGVCMRVRACAHVLRVWFQVDNIQKRA